MEAYNEMHREALEQYKEKLEREGAEWVERMIEKTIGTTNETEQAARDNAEKLAAYEAELMAE